MDQDRPENTLARSRPTRIASVVVTCIAAGTLGLLVASCSVTERYPVFVGNDVDDAAAPAFVAAPDADVDASTYELVNYCPSSACPPGYTTCPDSRYPCDVDLRNDLDNCGACGSRCPADNGNGEIYACVNGRCEYSCVYGLLDCDGMPDNGCETLMLSEGNCSACGEVCPADKPCVLRGPGGPAGCGCTDGKMLCPTGLPPPLDNTCIDVEDDDENCGGCGVECDPTDGGKTPPPNMYYGCLERECGKLKCSPGFGDCDGDLENGCETRLGTDEDCLVCGDACGAGQKCARTPLGLPFCACPKGLTFCGSCLGELCIGECQDTTSDQKNCGGCGVVCGTGGSGSDDAFTMLSVCEFGSCSTVCATGRADCNGARTDGCEIDTDSDPNNCGGCDQKCDQALGQACVNGKCVVEPCDTPDDAGVAR